MSPRGAGDSPYRWQEFLEATAGDPWWEGEEQALAGMVRAEHAERTAAQTTGGHMVARAMVRLTSAAPWTEMVIALTPGIVHVNALPPGWRVIVADQEYVPKPAPRPALRQRLAAWLRRRWERA